MDKKCIYPQKYYWDDSHIQHTYQCDEIPIDSGYCIFHDPEYLNEKHSDIKTRTKNLEIEFTKKLTKYIDSKTVDWLFIGHIIPGFTLDGINIEQNVFSDYADIRGKTNFKNSRFKKKASFQGTHFGSNIHVSRCDFEKTDFANCHFHKDSGIHDSVFHDETSFYSSVYFDEFNCSCCKFEKVDFGYCEFMKEAQFNNNKFLGEVHFHFTKFKNGSFDNSYFYSVLLFNVTDSDSIIITNCTINELDIHSAKVKLLLQFWRSKFLKEADFSDSTFGGVIDFRKCIFEDHLNFENTVFGEVDFSNSLFNGSAHFVETKFTKISFFNYVKFKRPEDIIFQRVDLAKVSLVNTDMSRINLMENIQFGQDNEFEILDERRLINTREFENENKRSKVNVGNVLAVYRGLRQNYESKLRYDESRNFLNREMNLKRRFRLTPLTGNVNQYFRMDLEKLLEKKELNELEFKPRLILEDKTKSLNRVRVEVLQNIASFMNMDNGGLLVLGITNDGRVCGIDKDIQSFPPRRQNIDNWIQSVDILIESHIGGYYTQYTSLKDEIYHNMTVVRFQIMKSEKPAYLKYVDPDTGVEKNEFYIRSNGRSIPLVGSAILDYVNEHWVLK